MVLSAWMKKQKNIFHLHPLYIYNIFYLLRFTFCLSYRFFTSIATFYDFNWILCWYGWYVWFLSYFVNVWIFKSLNLIPMLILLLLGNCWLFKQLNLQKPRLFVWLLIICLCLNVWFFCFLMNPLIALLYLTVLICRWFCNVVEGRYVS